MGVDQWVWEQVEEILAGDVKVALALTGGGSEAVSWLLNHPGASRVVLEVQIPYHEQALIKYLDQPGPHGTEAETARNLAANAFFRAKEIAGHNVVVVGMGCTAALATNRERKGADRACICLRNENEYHYLRLDFAKGAADRLSQEDVLSRFLLEVLNGMGEHRNILPQWAVATTDKVDLNLAIEALLADDVEVVEMGLDGKISIDVERQGRLLFPGSFNPLHQGHRDLAVVAAQQSGLPAVLELSVENVDKPRLAYCEILRRLTALRGLYPVLVTRAPTFVEKARLFNTPVFVIGADTASRLLKEQYYPDGVQGMAAAWCEKYRAGCHFLVAGRESEGRYFEMSDLAIPAAYIEMFEAIPEERFRQDISSSQIRARQIR